MRRISIVDTGMAVPERRITNGYLVADCHLDTTEAWIEKKTGIVERRCAGPFTTTSDLARLACIAAVGSRPLHEIDLIVLATTTPDHFIPATATVLQHKLCAKRAYCIDINNACTGFVSALDIASRYIDGCEFKRALVVGADVSTRIVGFENRETAVFFGDAAGAFLVEYSDDRRGVLASAFKTAGDGGKNLSIPGGACKDRYPAARRDGYMKMDGKAIWDFATSVFPDIVREVCDKADVKLADVDWIVPHQANANIIRESMTRLGLPQEKAVVNIDRYGNTISATVPVAFHEARFDERIKDGQKVILVGFGAGLSWGATLLQL